MKNTQAPGQNLGPILAALFAAVPSLAVAQAVAPVTPDAGSLLRQIQPTPLRTPAATGADLTVEKETATKRPSGEAFLVSAIRITGNKKIDTATLHALVTEGEGKRLTLAELEKLVDRITQYYRSQGYPLTRAIVPEQTIVGGVVNVQIIVARYGKVSLDNRSRVNAPLLLATISPLATGDDVEQSSLDKALLLLADIPGVVVAATLKPGDTMGSSDLDITATSGPGASGNVVLDNAGNRYTGRARVGASVNIIDPLNLKFSNVISLSALTSGAGLNYARVAYESVVNGAGSRLGGAYSVLRYKVGGSLAAVNAHGTAQVASLFVKQPFVRSPNANVYGQIQYDQLKLKDRVDVIATATDRHLENFTVGLSGDVRDSFLSGGVNTWSLSRTAGNVGFSNDAAQLLDATSAATQGTFSKWNASLTRLQSLGSKNGLYFAFSSQWADKNLDSSQKMSVGGSYSVRAYESGAISGDSAYLSTVEYRHDLGLLGEGQWQAVAFADSANVTVSKTPWFTGANTATLNGVGLGLNWAGLNRWNVKAYVANPVGGTPDLIGTKTSTRTWLEINRIF